MAALFLTVLELSIRGSLLILAILPIRVLLKKAPRWSICLLWALAAIALVCPVRFESTASVLPSETVISEIIAPAPTMPLVQTEPILVQIAHRSSNKVFPSMDDFLCRFGLPWFAVVFPEHVLAGRKHQSFLAVLLFFKGDRIDDHCICTG